MDNRLLTVPEIAKYFKLPRAYVVKTARENGAVYAKKGSRNLLDATQFAKWLSRDIEEIVSRR